MISSPFIVMGALGIAVTIGYLGLNNYQLRQESLEVAEIAERNDFSLDDLLDFCKKNTKKIMDRLSNSESAKQKISDEKVKLEEEMKKTVNDINAAMMVVDEEHEKLFIELELAEIQVANLTRRLYELTGQTPLPEEGSFSSENYGQESSIYSDENEEGEEEEET